MMIDGFHASYGIIAWDRRASTRRHVRWIIALTIACFLLPWLFAQSIPSNQQLRQVDQADALQSVGQTVGVGDKSAKETVIRWWSDILVAAQKTDVPPVLIAATVLQEDTDGNPQAAFDVQDPSAGAYGLMQLEPATAQGLPGYYPGARHNPQENLILGAELLKEDANTFGGNWLLASAAYYGGPGAVMAEGVDGNMPWSQAAMRLNVVPCPPGRNYYACYHDNGGITMTASVNALMKDMQTITHWEKQLALPTHMPRLFPKFLIPISLPAGVTADSLLGETIEIAEAAGDVAEAAVLIAAA